MLFAFRWSPGVNFRRIRVVIRCIEVTYPLPTAARHVIEAELACIELANRCGVLVSVIVFPAKKVCLVPAVFVIERIDLIICPGTSRVLPFSLCRQASPGPGTIVPCIFPGHVYNWQIPL